MEVTPYITTPDTCLSPLVYVPSDDAEILCFELYTGQLVNRYRGMEKNSTGRVTCVTGRAGTQVPLDLIRLMPGIIFWSSRCRGWCVGIQYGIQTGGARGCRGASTQRTGNVKGHL